MRSRALPFLAGIVVAVVLAFAAWLLLQGRVRIDLSRPAVVQRIQRLQRLETVVYSMGKIVTGAQDSAYLPNFLAGDRILLIVYGEVTAGIDLGKLTESSIEIDGKAITVTLPEAEVFSTRIDNARTQVYSRETGLLVRPDPNLESEARRAAEKQVQQSATESGILQTASANARATIHQLLEGLAFESVTIR